MKRRLIMGVTAVTAVFAVENIVDTLITRYIHVGFEIGIWMVIAVVSAAILYEAGDDRGDW